MTLSQLITRPCTIVYRTPTDEAGPYGDKLVEESTFGTVCELQQEARSERAESGELSDTRWVAFFLPGENLNTASALIVDGDTYEVVGDPWEARNPLTDTVSHIEVTLRRTASDEDEAGS